MDYALKKVETLIVLNEPYTPIIQNISFAYKADSGEVKISSVTLADYANEAVHFFQISYFGQMREHGYQRQQFSFLAGTSVTLLPTYSHEGELLIGFRFTSRGQCQRFVSGSGGECRSRIASAEPELVRPLR